MTAATALSRRNDDVTSIKSELMLIKWMMGFVLAFQIGIFAKLFLSWKTRQNLRPRQRHVSYLLDARNIG
ncbi:hypothetical protein CU103_12120 [Phyllobacterium sophorae]|uniref:Uncharacterized protein n=1 Tax=Phyllobacterium sophorae TaxID=1520277 RepID=A0A2P7BDU6_9HYPH|nr:hypothetical protein CU103_12120 [Phyllobacterium sophorae]